MKRAPHVSRERALNRITDEWQSAYRIGEHIDTLRALVVEGVAECRVVTWREHRSQQFRRKADASC